MNKRQITIVFIIDFLATREGITGGTERQLIGIVNYLNQSKFRPIIFCLQKFVETAYWKEIKCEKHLLHVYSIASLRGLYALFSLVRFLRKHKVDIIQTYFHDATLFGILAAKLAGVKIKISCRRDLGFWYDRKLLRNLSFVNRFTDRVLVNCQAVKEAVVHHENLASEKIDVIYNGLDSEAIDHSPAINLQSEFPEIRSSDRIVGMVANFNRPVKRADLFIEAAVRVLKQHQDVRFLLIGGGSREGELKDLIKRLGLNGKIILAGKKNPATPYIKSFDIGVLTSDSEGLSNVIMEYMAAGIPTVATNVGGNAELVEHGKTGLLVPGGDSQALARAIIRLLRDERKKQEMGSSARRVIGEQYSWDKIIREYENYYINLLNE